jgi:adenine-specific DNA-methyltransferase
MIDASTTHEPLGEVFTRRWVVEWMLDLVGWTSDRDLTALTLVEPSCGSGAFIGPIVERLAQSADSHGLALDELGDVIWACDLNEPSVIAARRKATAVLVEHGMSEDGAAALASKWFHHTDFLLVEHVPAADVVIGNPPYVRHDEIPTHLAEQYRYRWSTMRGRCDIYVPFFERGLEALNDGGVLGYICADRWQRNNYGTALRHLIHDRFNVESTISMHGVNAFEDEVDAYPSIILIRPGGQQNGVIIDCEPGFTGEDVAAATRLLTEHETAVAVAVPATVVRVDGWFGPGAWPEGDAEQIADVLRWEHTMEPLEDVFRRTKVGIGVATGADKAYIVHGDPPDVEPERLVPMVTAKHIRTGKIDWSPTWLVDPWDAHGPIDLEDWPKAKAFYEARRDQIGGRHVAKKNPQTWHRTIDRVHHWLTTTPKILLVDMKDRMTPVVDHGQYYPHHNLYWITSSRWDIEVLAGLLLADQTEAFIRAYCVKMRGGTLRMQAQYLRTIRLPSPDDVSEHHREALTSAYISSDRSSATAVAAHYYPQKGLRT